MSVYLDIAFLINFLFDTEIILLTLLVTSKKIMPYRIVLAGFLGGLEGVFVFFPYFEILLIPPISFLISFLLVFISVYPSKLKELFETYIFFLITAFLFGGIMSFFNLKTIFGLFLILPIYLAIIRVRKEIFKKRTRVTLCYKGREIEKNALYDSGNTVFYFGKPVIFASKELFLEILGEDFADEKDLCTVTYGSAGKKGISQGIRLEKAVVSGKSFDGAVICPIGNDLKEDVILNGIMV